VCRTGGAVNLPPSLRQAWQFLTSKSPNILALTIAALALTGLFVVTLDVVDNGIGIDPDAARSGLRNLERRTADCGGELTVRPVPEGGIRLRWQVPLG
jgi:signal transduction histidine kinase